MGKRKKAKPKGVAAYKEKIRERGAATMMDDVKKKIQDRSRRTSVVKTVMSKARSY